MASLNSPVSVDVFDGLGSKIMNKTPSPSQYYARRFYSLFGLSPTSVADLWKLLPKIPGGKPRYLLWGLLFLKLYDTEHVLSSLAGCDEKTFRKWVWIFVRQLAQSRFVSYYLSYIYFN